MKKAIVLGAGQIGRGFIGELCFDSGYFIVFVDVDKNLVNLLNKEKKYPVYLLGDKKKEKIIQNFKGILLFNEEKVIKEFTEAEVVFTSVGAKNLPKLAEIIGKGIKARYRENKNFLNIVICENLLNASNILKESIKQKAKFSDDEEKYFENKIGFVETVISRMTSPLKEEEKRLNPLIVKVEPYKILPVDKNAFKGKIPEITGFYPVENLKQYEELKLYGHNLSHAAVAYSGFAKGYTFIWECMEDDDILVLLKGVQKEVKQALSKKYDFEKKEIDNYFNDLNKRFKNKLLEDTVYRVGREPLRKLGENERIAGGIKLCLENGIFPENVCIVLAYTLCYNFNEDEEACLMQDIIQRKGVEFFLKEICKINNEEIIEKVIEEYKGLKNEMQSSST